MLDLIITFWESTGFSQLFLPEFWMEMGGIKIPGELIMLAIACTFLYLAIKKGYEPYLLIPIAFGMLLVNLPLGGLMSPGNMELVNGVMTVDTNPGLLYLLYQGTALGIYPPLISLIIVVNLTYN